MLANYVTENPDVLARDTAGHDFHVSAVAAATF